MRPLARRFYARPPEVVARALLGRLLVRDGPGVGERRIGRIVEVEAYGGARDPASHAFRGPTARNRTMFGPPGRAYIYVSYGVHHCLNVVTARRGRPSAVLIRALEPVRGLVRMERGERGGRGSRAPRSRASRTSGRDPLRVARGPGLVARALGLSLAEDGVDLTRGPLWLSAAPPRLGSRIARSPRIGISRAVSRRWRFYLAGHPSVSGPRGGSRPDRRPGGRPGRGVVRRARR
jgi:DNA-3-methyladenine glycosylase